MAQKRPETKPLPLGKSPVNVAVGELVKKHRARAGVDVHMVADSFGLSPAYVRAIEAGQRALPAYVAVGLVEQFGMTWPAASALVAVAGFLDLARDDNEYVADKLLELARRLRDRHSEYREFLDDLEEIVVSTIRPGPKGTASSEEPPSEWTVRTLALSHLLERCINKQSDVPQRRGIRSPASLSPVFEDIVEHLVDQLAMFPPHVNAVSIQRFEQMHSARIRSLLGFVSDSETLTASSVDDWQVVRGPLTPTVRVLVSKATTVDVELVAHRFRDALAKAVAPKAKLHLALADRVRVQSAGELQDDCTRALLFDFTTRSRAATGSPPSDAQRRFPNAWLYELQPQSQDSHVARWVGFLMDKDPVRGYAVAMNGDHVEEWLGIFRRAWPQETARSVRRSKRRSSTRSKR